jgi:hypothetical protein
VSDIRPLATNINENFPVAGQDNDTQEFRDNFANIKSALNTAHTEITDLQDNVARRDGSNDFNGNILENAILINNREKMFNGQEIEVSPPAAFTIDFQNGSYQVYTVKSPSIIFDFLNFPATGNSLGKVTLELYSNDGTPKTVNFSLSGSGANNIKKATGTTVPLTVASSSDPVIIEIWRHSTANFYMANLGSFS